MGPLQPEFPLYLGRIIAAALGRASATSEKRSDAENKSSFGDLFPPPDVEIDSKRKGDFEGVGGKKGGGGGKGGGWGNGSCWKKESRQTEDGAFECNLKKKARQKHLRAKCALFKTTFHPHIQIIYYIYNIK